MNPRPLRRLATAAAVLSLAAGLAACGDDDGDTEQAPVVTNEFGVETFEPGDDTFDLPDTVEPAP